MLFLTTLFPPPLFCCTTFSYLAVHLDAIAAPALASRIAKGLVDRSHLTNSFSGGGGSNNVTWLHRDEPSERHAALCFAHETATCWFEQLEDEYRK